MNEIWPFLLGLIPSIVTSSVVFYMQRAQKKRDDKAEGKAKARRTAERLSLDLQMAIAKLAYAVAMAIKRGTPNGEVEEGIEAYENALEQYRKFEREQITWL